MTNSLLHVLEQAIDKASACGATAADAVIFESQDVSVRQRLGKAEHIERAESKGLGLRVMIERDGGFAQAIISSTDISDDAIAIMAARAIDMAKVAPVDEYAGLADKNLLATNVKDLDLYDAQEPSVETLKQWASEAEDAAMAVEGVNNSEGADASFSGHHVAFATSHGFSQAYQTSSVSISTSVVAGDDDGRETDYDYSVAHHAADLKPAADIGKNAGERTVRKINPRKVETCQVPIVFEARVAKSLLGALSHAVNGSAVSKGTTFLASKMGEQIFDSSVTIHDNPLLARGLGSEPFDSEGVQGFDKKIIDNGCLSSWLLDTRSAKKLGLKTTGSAARGLSSVPHPATSNFYMEAGSVTVKALLSDIKMGFFVTDTFGMGVNDVTGDYSQGAAGFWIENGIITYAVSEVTIAGNLLDMFKQLTPADDLEMLYGTNSPTVRIEGMTLAGV